jgi:hypothetical protein
MARQMSKDGGVLNRAIVTMTETTPGGLNSGPRTFAPAVFGPHETMSSVKAAVTRYKRAFRSETTGRKPDGSYGWIPVERTFDVQYESAKIRWVAVES